MSCKQEDDFDYQHPSFMVAGSGPPANKIMMGGQFYQEPPFPDVSEAAHRNIEFKPIFREQWCATAQTDGMKVDIREFKVQADKGFNFSQVGYAVKAVMRGWKWQFTRDGAVKTVGVTRDSGHLRFLILHTHRMRCWPDHIFRPNVQLLKTYPLNLKSHNLKPIKRK